MPTIRPAKAQDWPCIETLLRASGLPVDGAREHLNGYLVAERTDAIVGTAGIEVYGDKGLLRSVAVSPAAQGSGVGHALVDAILADAHRRRLHGLYLLTTTASAYFARLGFVSVPRSSAPTALQVSAEFQGACPAAAEFMALRLAVA